MPFTGTALPVGTAVAVGAGLVAAGAAAIAATRQRPAAEGPQADADAAPTEPQD